MSGDLVTLVDGDIGVDGARQPASLAAAAALVAALMAMATPGSSDSAAQTVAVVGLLGQIHRLFDDDNEIRGGSAAEPLELDGLELANGCVFDAEFLRVARRTLHDKSLSSDVDCPVMSKPSNRSRHVEMRLA
jgi:hypothetical protein